MLKHNFRQLRIWIDAIQLAKDIYVLTQEFPKEHRLGIASQLYRAAISISSNIAEGSARGSEKEFCHFLRISLGSAFEVETQLIIAETCSLYKEYNYSALIAKLQVLQKQIVSFIDTLKKTA